MMFYVAYAIPLVRPGFCSELEFTADKCEDLTNHLPLLIKGNLQIFDILSSPTPRVGVGPGLMGES